jgi:hypothetical protein
MEHIVCSWQDAKRLNVSRHSPCGLYPMSVLDKGVNYFILALEKLGCKTMYSCEGHFFSKKHYIPQLYISFSSKKTQVLQLKNMLYNIAKLEHDCKDEYTLRIDFKNNKDKIQKLTKLAKQWNKILGPIKYETIL